MNWVDLLAAAARQDRTHATAAIGAFIEEVYNAQRLHSALDHLSLMEFENSQTGLWTAKTLPTAPTTTVPI